MSPADGRRPIVSVVMPVFNGGRFVQQAVHSIQTQTFTDFEFISAAGTSWSARAPSGVLDPTLA